MNTGDNVVLPTSLPGNVPAIDAIDFANDVLAKGGQHIAATTLRRVRREYLDLLRALIAERAADNALAIESAKPFSAEPTVVACQRVISARIRTDESLARIIGEAVK